jgi:hypothetical protein
MKRKKLLQDDMNNTIAETAEVDDEVCLDAAAPMNACSDGEDTDDSEEEIEFFKALQEMEGKDITQLKEMLEEADAMLDDI